jgi:uncharacterized protein (DUF1330 family)
MSAYITANLTITDPSWLESYGPAVNALVEKHGGRYIARDPGVAILEGDAPPPSVAVIIEFPDRAAAEAWYNDADYKPWLEARLAGSNGPLLLVDGL